MKDKKYCNTKKVLIFRRINDITVKFFYDIYDGLRYRFLKIMKNWIGRIILNLVLLSISISLVILFFGHKYFNDKLLVYTSDINKNVSVSQADAIYFSFITFFTIGYGDIVPDFGAPKKLILYECLFSLAINSYTVSVIIYYSLKRPIDIIISDALLVTKEKDDYYINARIINFGRKTVRAEITLEYLFLKNKSYENDYIRSRYVCKKTFSIFARSWEPDFKITNNHKLVLNGKLSDKEIGLRITVMAYDEKNSNTIVCTKNFTKSQLRYGIEFKGLYTWINVYKTKGFKYKNISRAIESEKVKSEFLEYLES